MFLYVLGLNSIFCFYFSWRIVELEGADFAMYIGLSLFSVFSFSGLVMIGFQVYHTGHTLGNDCTGTSLLVKESVY